MTYQTSVDDIKSAIDWDATRAEMSAAQAALKDVGATSEAERERVWKERADQFAQIPAADSAADLAHLAIVRMGRELCAFDATFIESIRPAEQITRVPLVPNWIAGVSNIRGQIYSITDLQIFLGLNNESAKAEENREIVLVKTGAFSLALLVDQVKSVEMISEQDIKSVAETIHGVSAEYVRGVIEEYSLNNKKVPVLVLDLNALLSDERIYA